MLYCMGDILECTNILESGELEATNHYEAITPGKMYVISDMHVCSHESCWYQLTSLGNGGFVHNAWNDEGHMILDEKFKRVILGK